MSTTAPALTESAAALAGLLPTTTPLDAAPSAGAPVGPQAGSAVVASFVGATSADLAVALIDQDAVATAAGGAANVAVTDVLRPALEAAAAPLGAGVLGETRLEDATTLFEDPATAVFELSAQGTTAGWFGVRLREPVVIQQAARPAVDVAGKLGRINDVEMSLTVEIGRSRMSVRDVLDLEPGAVVELNRSAGAPADVLLNGRVIAYGEVVVVDGDYAVRITKILDNADGLS
ncbi:flagellar motor switch protein FliN [Georgenia sp. AZ-5]|uniref:flagellar motor switch protein FliN n=1 Tax=Georgenia sp. AZ-5 TaxID=3367526 RepID=UPI003754DE66